MAAVAYLVAHPEIPHAPTRICFTVDEEVGHGTDHIDLARFGADFAYTLDGEKVGEIENETWSALELKVTFHGVPVHPGIGKGKLVNPVKFAARFVESLPKDTLSPETTDGRDGFVHPLEITGDSMSATVAVYDRVFDWDGVLDEGRGVREARRGASTPDVTFERWEQYRNMRARGRRRCRTWSRRRSRRRGAWGSKPTLDLDPRRRHRRLAPHRDGAAHAEHLLRWQRVPLGARVDQRPGHGDLGGDGRPSC